MLKESWTVTKQDVFDYIDPNSFPYWINLKESKGDGEYLVKERTGYVYYYQERGRIEERSKVYYGSVEAARKGILTDLCINVKINK